MGGYDGYGYEDLDEYEEDFIDEGVEGDGEAEYQEQEEEAAPKPTKEVLDYLELRQRLKEQKRKKLKKEIGTSGSSLEKKNLISRDSYGSFFGPSQPVIAQRVIQESKSLLETASLSGRVNKSSQSERKSSGPSLSATKSQSSGHRPKVPNGQHKKLEIIKNTRDYSFLLSDDAELPAPKKDPLPRNVSAPRPEARPAPQPERNKGSFSNGGRKDFGSREDRRSSATVNRLPPKVGTERLSSGANQVRASMDSKKHIGATNGTLADRKHNGATNGTFADRKYIGATNGTLTDKRHHSASNSNGTLADRRKQLPSSNGSGPGRPLMTKIPPSKVPVGTSDKRSSLPVSRNSTATVVKPTTSKSHAPVSKQSLVRREEYQVQEKPKLIPKQSVPAAKSKQVIRPPPKNIARDTSHDERLRKRPLRPDEDDDDPVRAISMIRSMFGYNPRRYQDEDDDSDMEANFDDIMAEERRSAKIARQEDEEELRKIEEEERRERMRKQAKKRKLGSQ